MKKYKVTITETNAFYFIVEAQDEEEAEEIGIGTYFGDDPYPFQKPTPEEHFKGVGFEVYNVEEVTE